ncbi:hypothetical protein [Mesobacillus zeae]|nr:hypothetical protein [Mesobacillus zeae]
MQNNAIIASFLILVPIIISIYCLIYPQNLIPAGYDRAIGERKISCVNEK